MLVPNLGRESWHLQIAARATQQAVQARLEEEYPPYAGLKLVIPARAEVARGRPNMKVPARRSRRDPAGDAPPGCVAPALQRASHGRPAGRLVSVKHGYVKRYGREGKAARQYEHPDESCGHRGRKHHLHAEEGRRRGAAVGPVTPGCAGHGAAEHRRPSECGRQERTRSVSQLMRITDSEPPRFPGRDRAAQTPRPPSTAGCGRSILSRAGPSTAPARCSRPPRRAADPLLSAHGESCGWSKRGRDAAGRFYEERGSGSPHPISPPRPSPPTGLCASPWTITNPRAARRFEHRTVRTALPRAGRRSIRQSSAGRARTRRVASRRSGHPRRWP